MNPESNDMPNEPQDTSDPGQRTGLLITLGAVLIIVVIALVLFFNAAKKETPPTPPPVAEETPKTLTISQTELTMNQGGMVENLTVTYGGEDVTQKAFWYSDDPTIASVSNIVPDKGQVQAIGEGETTVRAIYEEVNAETRLSIYKNAITVTCSPRKGEVSVGEDVLIVGIYNGMGVPPYSYQWSGDEDITGDDGMVQVSYKTPGVKRVNFATVDSAGQEADGDCTVTVTQ